MIRPLSRVPWARPRRSRRSGFTVVEMLIAVGAVALIGVGLAQLFERTGETVRIGRRVSAMNEYAALFERTMRADLNAITRNGFIVMRHREVGDETGQGIPLSANDRTPKLQQRRRRVDQIAFFTEGRYTSLREPLHPDKHAGGTAARVWYGHGLSRPTEPTATLDDDNSLADSFGRSAAAGGVGANQFAGSWILMRHQTVLARPQGSAVAPTGGASSQADSGLTAQWADSPIQIGLQPASPTIFRCERLQGLAGTRWARDGDTLPNPQPLLASGIVDVASMDLNQIRTRVISPEGLNFQPVRPSDGGLLPISVLDPAPRPFYQNGDLPSVPGSDAARMKEWMAYSLPAGPISGPPDLALTDPNAPERRMRCELTPPDYLGAVRNEPAASARSWQRSDQLMLTSSNLIPGCTEFIVEWSFGLRHPGNDPAGRGGQLIWHGLPRYLDLDNDGLPDSNDPNAKIADIYLANSAAPTAARATDAYATAYLEQNIGFEDDGSGFKPVYQRYPAAWPALASLIHLPADASAQAASWPAGRSLFSLFGYVDPTYVKSRQISFNYFRSDYETSTDPAGNPDALPWAWPRFIRVTMSLVDPADPDNEQTYQFVFDLPKRPAN